MNKIKLAYDIEIDIFNIDIADKIKEVHKNHVETIQKLIDSDKSKKCGNCNYWNMERNGECDLEVFHNRSYRYDSKACGGWAKVPSADDKPEPKKEVFYHIGQKFRQEDSEYILTMIPDRKAILIHREAGIHWRAGVRVEDGDNITESEFRQIKGGTYPFTLIEDKVEK